MKRPNLTPGRMFFVSSGLLSPIVAALQRPGWADGLGGGRRAQDLGARYPAGMTNHVHVEITGGQGGRLDPLWCCPTSQASIAGRWCDRGAAS